MTTRSKLEIIRALLLKTKAGKEEGIEDREPFYVAPLKELPSSADIRNVERMMSQLGTTLEEMKKFLLDQGSSDAKLLGLFEYKLKCFNINITKSFGANFTFTDIKALNSFINNSPDDCNLSIELNFCCKEDFIAAFQSLCRLRNLGSLKLNFSSKVNIYIDKEEQNKFSEMLNCLQKLNTLEILGFDFSCEQAFTGIKESNCISVLKICTNTPMPYLLGIDKLLPTLTNLELEVKEGSYNCVYDVEYPSYIQSIYIKGLFGSVNTKITHKVNLRKIIIENTATCKSGPSKFYIADNPNLVEVRINGCNDNESITHLENLPTLVKAETYTATIIDNVPNLIHFRAAERKHTVIKNMPSIESICKF